MAIRAVRTLRPVVDCHPSFRSRPSHPDKPHTYLSMRIILEKIFALSHPELVGWSRSVLLKSSRAVRNHLPPARAGSHNLLTRTSTILLEGLKDHSNGTAWGEFDARYRPLLMAVGRRLGLSSPDAEDAAQEALSAFTQDYRVGRYQRERGRLRDWLTGIMTHKVRDLQRKQDRHGKLVAASAAEAVDALDESVRTAMDQEWTRATLRQCLEEIRQDVSPQMFESFELSTLQLWPARQVAQRLGISVDLVYQNKTRVLQRLRELLPRMEESW